MAIRENIKDFPYEGDPVIFAIGNNQEQAEIADFLQCKLEKAIHPSVWIAENSTIREDVFAGAILRSYIKIGKHDIINASASFHHDNIIGDFANVSPKAALYGHVEVGIGRNIDVGAIVIPKVKIGKWCTLGAGTVVLKDVPDFVTAVGNPAKIIKSMNQNEY